MTFRYSRSSGTAGVLHRAVGVVRRNVEILTSLSMVRADTTIRVWLVILLAFGAAALRLNVETSISSLLDTSSASWTTYQESLDRHGGDEFVSIVVESESPLEPSALDEIERLTEAIESIPGVARVDGIASVALIRPDGAGGVSLAPALEAETSRSESSREGLKQALQTDLIAQGAYISSDLRSLALNVVLNEDILGDRDGVVAAIEDRVGSRARISGVPIFRTRINADTRAETAALIPFSLLIMSAILYFALRSITATALPLSVGGIGTVATVGAMGATGTPLSISTMILPSVQLALGCAYAMHVVSAASGVDDLDEATFRVSRVSFPVALSGFTTTVGFLSLSTSSIETIRDLAFFGAFGVVVTTSACITLLPAVIATATKRGGLPPTHAHSWLQESLASQAADFGRKNPALAMSTWATLTIIAALGLTQIASSTNIVTWYPTDSKIRSDYNRIRTALSGISPVSIYVKSDSDRGVAEPDVVHALDSLAKTLEGRDDVGKAIAIGHPLRLMRRSFKGPDTGLPETRAETQQYLLLLESEEPIWDLISRDQRTARVALRVDDNASLAIMDVATFAENWWATNGPSDFTAHATGVMYEFAKTNQAIVRTQISGLLLAFGGVAVVLWLLLGRFELALAALVPNLIPLTIAYGSMGYLGVPLDAGTACLGSLALGIAVDDTVHICSRWSREREKGMDADKSISASLSGVMPALFLSTACIVAGFGVLGFSDLGLVRSLGLMTASVVFLCWLADVTLLPVMLNWVDRRTEPT